MTDETISGKKILVVEDDPSSKIYLNAILNKAGAIVVNAADGLEALKEVENNKDIDLVLMDIQLPLIDGYSAARKIRGLGIKIKIIAQTAYGLASDIEEIESGGFDDYLIKPIYSDQLLSMIKKVLINN